MTRPVLHVVPAVASRYGGPSAAVVGLCRALEGVGVPTLIATTDADGPGRLQVPIGTRTVFNGIGTVFFSRHLGEAFKWSGGLSRWLRSNVRDFALVHVHAVFSHSSVAAGRACRATGVPYLVRPLGSLDPWSLSRRRGRKAWFFRLGGRTLLTSARAMHYTTEDEQRLAEEAVPGLPRGIVAPLGIDEAFFSSAVDGSARAADRYVLSLARLDEKKGVDVLIRAFHDAANGLEPWNLVIAGDGDPAYVSHLRQLAGEGPARGRIQFRGWVGGADKVTLVAGASLFALPSHQENFGISVAEAMAASVPVVVSPAVNLASRIEATSSGWVVPREHAAFAAALRSAMVDDAERCRRGRAARQAAEEFHWPAVAMRLKSIYAELDSGNREPRTTNPEPRTPNRAPRTAHPEPRTANHELS